VISVVIVEMFANHLHFVFEGLVDGLGVAFAAGHAADIGRIDAEALRYALVETAKNRERRKRSYASIRFVTFHDAFQEQLSRGAIVTS
jgi:hypothetical protein